MKPHGKGLTNELKDIIVDMSYGGCLNYNVEESTQIICRTQKF